MTNETLYALAFQATFGLSTALPLLLLDDHNHPLAIPATTALLLTCTYLLITLTPLHPQ